MLHLNICWAPYTLDITGSGSFQLQNQSYQLIMHCSRALICVALDLFLIFLLKQ